jgi:hypothetical protein
VVYGILPHGLFEFIALFYVYSFGILITSHINQCILRKTHYAFAGFKGSTINFVPNNNQAMSTGNNSYFTTWIYQPNGNLQ